jgi:uncharacterized membrane protein
MAAVDSFMLGAAPERMTVVLAAGTDFVATLTRDDGVVWPDGTVVELRVGSTTWAATVAGATVTWDVDEVAVDAVLATNPTKARLYYVAGATRMLWASGPVVVR